jgi:uncharacterized protein YecE (DUF72 family)
MGCFGWHRQPKKHPIDRQNKENRVSGTGPFWIGTSGWTYDHWKGRFYPDGLVRSKWFNHYAGIFSTVEINATFYRTFKDQTYANWRNKAPEGFSYVLKAPRPITHYKLLEGAEEEILVFWQSACLLKEKLGLILLQVAPQTPYDPNRLEHALRAFPDPSRVAVEFRNAAWLNPEIRSLLAQLGSVYCDADSPKSHLKGWVSSKIGYIRLHGREHWYFHNYTQEELEEIANTARNMVQQGAEKVYIFFNNDFEGYAPQNAVMLQNMLA